MNAVTETQTKTTIRLEMERTQDGWEVSLAFPDRDTETLVCATEAEAQTCMQRVLLVAEEMLRQGTVQTITSKSALTPVPHF